MNRPEHAQLQQRSPEQLQQLSLEMSKRIIEITTRAGSGHPSSSLSAIDILACLYLRPIMRYDPHYPDWTDRDRFIMSKGHAAPALYVTMAHAGFFSPDILPTLRELDSPLEGHPNMRALPGLESSTGSLGQGLSIAIGHALAAKIDNAPYAVYVMLGDGEVQEGQIWEGVMFAAGRKLDNITAIIDHNQFQQTNAVKNVMPTLYPLAPKWRQFGWHVAEIDGHDIPAILRTFEELAAVRDKPKMIVAHTLKGKGLSSFEEDTQSRKHGKPLEEDEIAAAISELQRQYEYETAQ
ncbi:MAG TPA: transketolase [Anaerohalosphaeraceae bacterium]|jgi:transketolase|nr:transketolase [Anaerohalosphaeraceae bacterium]HRT50339.1 transketolase [Anaerohalosphaeraceae bacterium]HRT86270.1 transketolase [Anaerohalosphaeraceae bacterium]